MNWLRIFDLLDSSFLSGFVRSSGKEERRNAENEALAFVQTQRARRTEKENLKEQLAALDILKARPEADPRSIKALEEELALKERLLASGAPSIERNEYNASILDAYERECEDIRRIEELKAELRKSEKEGKISMIGPLQEEIREREGWLRKDVLGKLWPTQE